MESLKCGLLFAGLLCVPLIVLPLPGAAQVSVDIHIGPPPPYRIAAPPPMVVIPGTYVYMVPGIGVDVFFYSGYWYRPYEGRWFSARSYNGPWVYCPDPRVPRALLDLPPDYRRIPPGHRRIPYGQFKKNWAAWERDRYWDRDRESHDRGYGRPEERRDERQDWRGEEHGREGERGHGHGR